MKKEVKSQADKSESKIQQEIVQWYRNNYCLKHHSPRCMILSIPNEGRKAASAQLIATGLYPGASDLVVIHYDRFYIEPYRVAFIEIKTETGEQSDKQKEFEEHCKQVEKRYFLVRSLEEFKQVIEKL